MEQVELTILEPILIIHQVQIILDLLTIQVHTLTIHQVQTLHQVLTIQVPIPITRR